MKKMLRTTDKIISVLALFGDLALESFVRSRGFGWNRSWSEALSVKNSTFGREVNRFLKTGDIEKIVDKKGNAYYKLTSLGIERFERLFPLSKLSKVLWDKKWRFVVFDIQEKEKNLRNYLRRKLLSLGLGKLQESIYITPLDILSDLKEFLRAEGLLGRVLVFEARDLLGLDPKDIANFIWGLEKINEEYRELIFDFKESDGQGEKIKKIREKYFQILLRDPNLPNEFLPDGWLGNKAKTFFFDK